MQMIVVHSMVNKCCPNRDTIDFYPVEKMPPRITFYCSILTILHLLANSFQHSWTYMSVFQILPEPDFNTFLVSSFINGLHKIFDVFRSHLCETWFYRFENALAGPSPWGTPADGGGTWSYKGGKEKAASEAGESSRRVWAQKPR